VDYSSCIHGPNKIEREENIPDEIIDKLNGSDGFSVTKRGIDRVVKSDYPYPLTRQIKAGYERSVRSDPHPAYLQRMTRASLPRVMRGGSHVRLMRSGNDIHRMMRSEGKSRNSKILLTSLLFGKRPTTNTLTSCEDCPSSLDSNIMDFDYSITPDRNNHQAKTGSDKAIENFDDVPIKRNYLRLTRDLSRTLRSSGQDEISDGTYIGEDQNMNSISEDKRGGYDRLLRSAGKDYVRIMRSTKRDFSRMMRSPIRGNDRMMRADKLLASPFRPTRSADNFRRLMRSQGNYDYLTRLARSGDYQRLMRTPASSGQLTSQDVSRSPQDEDDNDRMIFRRRLFRSEEIPSEERGANDVPYVRLTRVPNFSRMTRGINLGRSLRSMDLHRATRSPESFDEHDLDNLYFY
jgi:hypothetical protein